jgi:hypothetical protein
VNWRLNQRPRFCGAAAIHFPTILIELDFGLRQVLSVAMPSDVTWEHVGAVDGGSPEKQTPTLADQFADVIGSAPDLPSDLGAQHDHYLHGSPKS